MSFGDQAFLSRFIHGRYTTTTSQHILAMCNTPRQVGVPYMKGANHPPGLGETPFGRGARNKLGALTMGTTVYTPILKLVLLVLSRIWFGKSAPGGGGFERFVHDGFSLPSVERALNTKRRGGFSYVSNKKQNDAVQVGGVGCFYSSLSVAILQPKVWARAVRNALVGTRLHFLFGAKDTDGVRGVGIGFQK